MTTTTNPPGLPLRSSHETLRRDVAALLDRAATIYGGAAAGDRLRAARLRLDGPLRVAIAGKVKAGKSTLLNALVGQPLAPTDAGECTRIVTWYTGGVTYRVTLHPVDGPATDVPFRRVGGALEIRLGGRDAAAVERLEVECPSSSLRALTLIDTPGIGSVSTDVSARTTDFLTPTDQPSDADAVCYLMRHLHATDAGFLEAFHDAAAPGTPLNAVGVLARADEIGAGRLNALSSAERIARRYRRDPRVLRLCQTVLPVAGLLAETAATLRQDEFTALARLVEVDRGDLADLLLSADRFAATAAPVDLGEDVRRGLLGRFGVYGIRVSVALIRSGQATTAPDLAAALLRRSGIDQLRETLTVRFAARADLLQARSALAVLAAVIRTHPVAGADPLRSEIERITAGTHAFAEARLLDALRAGRVPLDSAAVEEAERLLGGRGDDAASRLGLNGQAAADDIDGATVRSAATEALGRWRRRREHPFASRAAVEAAALVVRSCEGMLAQLAQAPASDA